MTLPSPMSIFLNQRRALCSTSFSFFIIVIFFKEGTNAIHSEPQFHVARERLKKTVDTAPVRGGFYLLLFFISIIILATIQN